MKQIDATAKADYGRKVHVHGYPSPHGTIAIVLQTGPTSKRRPVGEGDGLAAYMTRKEAVKLHRALTRILKPEVR